jgi:hypothetical protein
MIVGYAFAKGPTPRLCDHETKVGSSDVPKEKGRQYSHYVQKVTCIGFKARRECNFIHYRYK